MAGIYIHIPYCKQACHYCDFHFSTNTSKVQEMVTAIKKELALQRDYLQKPIKTIYFGGGTPSLLSSKQLVQILDSVHTNFSVQDFCEVTLEANPDDLSTQSLGAIKGAGINRLSIGIQSFDDEILKFINRAHNSQTADRSILLAREAGFENISIDLMYAIPGLSLEGWNKHVEKAISYDPVHISAYSLTIEPRTVFGNWQSKNKLNAVDETFSAEQFEQLSSMLQEAGYQHYEISNFCKPGHHSKHNSNYWGIEPYLGVGPSAHSFNIDSRQFNVRNNARYIKEISQGKIPCEIEVLSRENKINEFILTRLRTVWGCDTAVLSDLYQYDLLKERKVPIDEMIQNRLMTLDDNTLKLTAKGKLFADKIATDLFLIAS